MKHNLRKGYDPAIIVAGINGCSLEQPLKFVMIPRGSSEDGHNCYFCLECDRDMDCVPPPEWIGEAD